MRRITYLLAAVAFPLTASAQSADPPDFSQEEEIALALSAAPEELSVHATVMVLVDGRYRVARTGTNGMTCIVSRSLPLSVEPICYDPEASRTVMKMELRQIEMRLDGVDTERIDEIIDEAIERGELPMPERPALAYMMSAGQVLYRDAETRVGSFFPHVHMYVPYATAEQFGGLSTGTSSGGPIIVDAGLPTANLIFLARDFVEPAATSTSGGR